MGISVDDLDTQKKFAAKNELPYPLFADKEKKAAKAYGVLTERGYAARTTFIIDKKGKVRKIYPKAEAKKNAEEVLAWVKKNLAEK